MDVREALLDEVQQCDDVEKLAQWFDLQLEVLCQHMTALQALVQCQNQPLNPCFVEEEDAKDYLDNPLMQ